MKIVYSFIFCALAGAACVAAPVEQPYLCTILCAVAKLPDRVPSSINYAIACLKEQKNIAISDLTHALDDCHDILEKYHSKIKRTEDVACLHDQVEQYRATFEYITSINDDTADSIIDDLVTRSACKSKEFITLIVRDCLKVKNKLLVCGNAEFGSNITVAGNLTVEGDLSAASIAIASLNVCDCTLFVDCENNRVGINTCEPTTALDVVGSATIRGDVEFQPSPTLSPLLRAIGSQFASGLRVIRGKVNTATAGPTPGEGFTSSSGGLGIATVTFTNSFTAIPVIVATTEPVVVTDTNVATLSAIATTGFTIRNHKDDGTAANATVDFIAIGI